MCYMQRKYIYPLWLYVIFFYNITTLCLIEFCGCVPKNKKKLYIIFKDFFLFYCHILMVAWFTDIFRLWFLFWLTTVYCTLNRIPHVYWQLFTVYWQLYNIQITFSHLYPLFDLFLFYWNRFYGQCVLLSLYFS